MSKMMIIVLIGFSLGLTGFYLDSDRQLTDAAQEIKGLRVRVSDQATLINEMAATEIGLRADVEYFEDLSEEYLQHADILASFKVQDQLPPSKILELTANIPVGNPFQSKHWFRSASFGESVGLHGAYRTSHKGIDIWSYDNRLQATGCGVVKEVQWDRIFGLYMLIQYSENVRVILAHLSKVYYIADVGQEVSPGETIALMGNTGMSDNAHLHFQLEIKIDGVWTPINPEPYLTKE